MTRPARGSPARPPTRRRRWSATTWSPPTLALTEAITRHGSAELVEELTPLGAEAGTAEAREHGMLANRHHPELTPYDRFGNRIDEVEFHPSWHWLMERARRPRPAGRAVGAAGGRRPARPPASRGRLLRLVADRARARLPDLDDVRRRAGAAGRRRHRQGVDAAAGGPVLRPRASAPRTDKVGALAGMGMTEKQGGSDVRANQTQARCRPPRTAGTRCTGTSGSPRAPMNDLFLVLAQTAAAGVTCFVVPRVLADGTRNRIDVVRLKDKLGNRSNASSELELDGTLAQRLGDEGRGVRTIIEMVAATRLDCVLGSAALMRHALAEASWHVAHRSAFGGLLVDKPLMQNVVADLAVESEAATALAMRLAAAVDRPGDAHEVGAAPDRAAAGEVLGLQAHARRWWRRRSSASAATATSRSPACRCCSASRRSTRSGRARATSTPSTCCAPSAASPRSCRPGSPRSARRAAPTSRLDRAVDDTLALLGDTVGARGRRPSARRPDGRLPAGLAAGAVRAARGRRCVLRQSVRDVVRRHVRDARPAVAARRSSTGPRTSRWRTRSANHQVPSKASLDARLIGRPAPGAGRRFTSLHLWEVAYSIPVGVLR